MKILDHDAGASSTVSYAGLIEKIEILRSALRWASKLDRPDIEKLLRQAGALRDEVMQLSHKERFVNAAAAEPTRSDLSRRQRREGLIQRSFIFEGAFGDNPKLLESLETAEKAAPTGLPVLIDGESGTGKELMAKVIHANGDRAHRPFVSVNCGAIPDNLLELNCSGIARECSPVRSVIGKGKFESARARTPVRFFRTSPRELPVARPGGAFGWLAFMDAAKPGRRG